MNKPVVSLLITDLDNTLYDWISAFVPAFYAMIVDAAQILGITEDELLDDLRLVHQAHGDTEHPFALVETRIVQTKFAGWSQAEIRHALDPAFYAFNRARKARLRLYDGVRETLAYLNEAGLPIVAYTDARVVHSVQRLKRLDIKQLFRRLYAPAHFKITLDECNSTEFVRLLPANDRKPNPRALLDICDAFGVEPANALYVGDSMSRDVYMANRAGVESAWAKYGTGYDHALWHQLVRVSHWTEADVRREHDLKVQAKNASPTATLDRFDELLTKFDFVFGEVDRSVESRVVQ